MPHQISYNNNNNNNNYNCYCDKKHVFVCRAKRQKITNRNDHCIDKI